MRAGWVETNLKAIAIGVLWAIFGLWLAYEVGRYQEGLALRGPRGDLVRLCGPSASKAGGITIVYPTFALHRSNPNDKPDYSTVIAGVRSQAAEPDEVVNARDLMGLEYTLDMVNQCQLEAGFQPHSSFANPGDWPASSLVAVGGPAVNQVAYYSLPPGNQYLAFDTHTTPWTIMIAGGPTLHTPSTNLSRLDYGFLVRVPQPASPGDFVVMLFGEGAFGTEAACYYAKMHTKVAADLLEQNGRKNHVIALEVRNGAYTTPQVIYPRS